MLRRQPRYQEAGLALATLPCVEIIAYRVHSQNQPAGGMSSRIQRPQAPKYWETPVTEQNRKTDISPRKHK